MKFEIQNKGRDEQMGCMKICVNTTFTINDRLIRRIIALKGIQQVYFQNYIMTIYVAPLFELEKVIRMVDTSLTLYINSFDLEEKPFNDHLADTISTDKTVYNLYESLTDTELQKCLMDSVNDEDYEEAARCRDEINRRAKSGQTQT